MAAREWLLVFVVAVTLHAFTDFGSPLTQLRKPVRLAIAALLVGVTGLSILGAAGSAPPAPADRVVMQSLAQLPIGRLMPMTGRSTDAMIESLSAMGVSDVNVGSSIRSLSGHDRRRESQLLAAVFRDE